MVNHGLDFRTMPPLPDSHTQPALDPGCSGSARGQLMELAMLRGSALAKGAWLAIGWFSRVQSRVPIQITSPPKLQKDYICYMYNYD